VADQTERLLRDGIDIISPACGLSTTSSIQNIKALTKTVKEHGEYARSSVLPAKQVHYVEEGTTILQAARSAGVIIESRATVQELAENAK